jgi:glycogen(starch) synthase
MADEVRHALKILLVSEDVPYPRMGGLAKHALTLARALVRAGHSVDFLGNSQYPIEAAASEGQFGGRFFGELGGHRAGWKEHSLGVFLPPKRPWQARALARVVMRHADRKSTRLNSSHDV